MNPTLTATLLGLAAVFILHRLALAGPLAYIWARRDRTRDVYANAEELLNEIRRTAVQMRDEAEQPSEHLMQVLELLDGGYVSRGEAAAQAIQESRWRILALLLTTPAYIHVWREYRAAQIMLNAATWQLIKVKHEVDASENMLDLLPLSHLIHEYELTVAGNNMAMCQHCLADEEYLCYRAVETPHGPVPHLTCKQRSLLLAAAPQRGDWAYNLLCVSE